MLLFALAFEPCQFQLVNATVHPNEAETAEIQAKHATASKKHEKKLKRRRVAYAEKHGLEPDDDDDSHSEDEDDEESASSLSSPLKRGHRDDDDSPPRGGTSGKRPRLPSTSTSYRKAGGKDAKSPAKRSDKQGSGGQKDSATQIIVADDYKQQFGRVPTVQDLFGEINDISSSSGSGKGTVVQDANVPEQIFANVNPVSEPNDYIP